MRGCVGFVTVCEDGSEEYADGWVVNNACATC